MEPEGSLPHSQQPATCFYPEADSVQPMSSDFLKIHFNIILPSRTTYSKLSLSLRFPLYAPLLSLLHLAWLYRYLYLLTFG
jgi:hypothetical protein